MYRERVFNPLALRYLLWFTSSLTLDVALGAAVVWQVTSFDRALAAGMLVAVQMLSAAAAPLMGRFVDIAGIGRSLVRVALVRVALALLLTLALLRADGGMPLLVAGYAVYAVFSTALRFIEQITLQFVVSRSGWARINAVHGVLYDAAWALGPVMGTALVQFGAAYAIPLILAAVSSYTAYYAVTWARGWAVEARADPGAPAGGTNAGLLWVVRYVASRPVLVRVLLLGALWNLLFLGPIALLLPVLIQERSLPPLAYGLLSGAWPVGFMAGIAVAGHRMPSGMKAQKLLAWYALLLTVQGLVVVPMALSRDLVWMAGWYALAGFASGPTDVIVKLIRQHEVPVSLQGRYLGLGGLIAPLAAAGGTAVTGVALHHYSSGSLLAALGLGLSTLAFLVFLWPVSRPEASDA